MGIGTGVFDASAHYGGIRVNRSATGASASNQPSDRRRWQSVSTSSLEADAVQGRRAPPGCVAPRRSDASGHAVKYRHPMVVFRPLFLKQSLAVTGFGHGRGDPTRASPAQSLRDAWQHRGSLLLTGSSSRVCAILTCPPW